MPPTCFAPLLRYAIVTLLPLPACRRRLPLLLLLFAADAVDYYAPLLPADICFSRVVILLSIAPRDATTSISLCFRSFLLPYAPLP